MYVAVDMCHRVCLSIITKCSNLFCLQFNSDLYGRDHEGLGPLDLLVKDRPKHITFGIKGIHDHYVLFVRLFFLILSYLLTVTCRIKIPRLVGGRSGEGGGTLESNLH